MKIGNLIVAFITLALFTLPAYAHMSDLLHIHAEHSILLLCIVSFMLVTSFVLLYRGKK